MRCQSCSVMHIQGVRVHERGCPDAHRDETRECGWCGTEFSPEDGNAKFCSAECCNSFNGYPNEDDLDIPDEDILVAVEIEGYVGSETERFDIQNEDPERDIP